MASNNLRTADWHIHATIDDDSDRVVWACSDEDGKNVFQITYGDAPDGSGGYHRLESLLSLKGIPERDLCITDVQSP